MQGKRTESLVTASWMVIKLGQNTNVLSNMSRCSGIVQGQGFPLSFLIYKIRINLHATEVGVRTKDNANKVFSTVSDTQNKKKNNSKSVLAIYYVPGLIQIQCMD